MQRVDGRTSVRLTVMKHGLTDCCPDCRAQKASMLKGTLKDVVHASKLKSPRRKKGAWMEMTVGLVVIQ